MIPHSSNHPAQHKYAAIRFLYNRLNTYNLHEDEYRTEENTTHSIMFNIAFPIYLRNPPHLRKITTPNSQTNTTTRKWATFTYGGRETTLITSLFKKTGLKIALRTDNTIEGLLMHNKQITDKTDKYTQSGVYKLTCPDCNKTYVRQTGRNFLARFNEHKPHSRRIAILQTLQNTSSNRHTLSAPSTTQCRYYNATAKGHTSIPLSDTTRVQNLLKQPPKHTIYPNKIFEALLKPDQP